MGIGNILQHIFTVDPYIKVKQENTGHIRLWFRLLPFGFIIYIFLFIHSNGTPLLPEWLVLIVLVATAIYAISPLLWLLEIATRLVYLNDSYCHAIFDLEERRLPPFSWWRAVFVCVAFLLTVAYIAHWLPRIAYDWIIMLLAFSFVTPTLIFFLLLPLLWPLLIIPMIRRERGLRRAHTQKQ